MMILTTEQGRELKGLYEQMPAAIANHGMSSQEFRDADGRLGAIFSRIREIQGS